MKVVQLDLDEFCEAALSLAFRSLIVAMNEIEISLGDRNAIYNCINYNNREEVLVILLR